MKVNADSSSALIKFQDKVSEKKQNYKIGAEKGLFENNQEREAWLQKRVEFLENVVKHMEGGTPVPPLELPLSPASSHYRHTASPKSDQTPIFYQSPTGERSAYHTEEEERCSEGSDGIPNSTPSMHKLPLNHTKCEHMIESLQEYNKELRRAVVEENELRINDQKMYNEVLERVYHYVKELQIQNEIPVSVDNDIFPQWLLEQAVVDIKNSSGPVNYNSSCVVDGNKKNTEDQNVKNIPSAKNPFTRLLEATKYPYNERKKDYILKTRNTNQLQGNLVEDEKLMELQMKENMNLKEIYNENVCTKSRVNVVKYRKVYKRLMRCFGRQRHAMKQMQNKYRVLLNASLKLSSECQILRSNVQEKLLTLRDNQIRIKALEELLVAESSATLKGRLSAANEVMTRQRKHIEEQKHQMEILQKQLENVRSRLARADSLNANRQTMMENYKRQTQDAQQRLEELVMKNKVETVDASELKENVTASKSQILILKNFNKKLQVENRNFKDSYEGLIESTKIQVFEMCEVVDNVKRESEAAECTLKEKLTQLRLKHTNSMKSASNKIKMINVKIQELYRSIELFLTLLSQYHLEHMSSLGEKGAMCESEGWAEAVKLSSAILNISPMQLSKLIRKQPDYKLHELEKWIGECEALVHKDEFYQPLGQFLFDSARNKFTVSNHSVMPFLNKI